MLVPRILALSACLAVSALLCAPAIAQNAARGHTLYNSFPYGCSDCHGGISNPKNDPEKGKPSGGVKSGIVWENIRLGINSTIDGNNAMTSLLKPFYDANDITDADLQDISAYLQGVFGGVTPPAGTVAAPGSAAFGSVTVGGSSLQSVTVTVATAAVSFTAASLSGANASDFTISTNTCTGSVSPGTCQVGVSFHPAAAGRSRRRC